MLTAGIENLQNHSSGVFAVDALFRKELLIESKDW